MTVGHAETVAAWREILGLCRLHRDETVAILTKREANPRNVEAAKHAVHPARASLRWTSPLGFPLGTRRGVHDCIGAHGQQRLTQPHFGALGLDLVLQRLQHFGHESV